METKEAIKLIKILKDALYEAYLIGKTYVGGTEGFQKNIDDIISLLEQGENYKEHYEKCKSASFVRCLNTCPVIISRH